MADFETVTVETDLLLCGGGMASCGAAVEAAYGSDFSPDIFHFHSCSPSRVPPKSAGVRFHDVFLEPGMPPASEGGLRGFLARVQSLIFPVLIVTSVLVIVAPLPPMLLDMLLASNITVAVVILLTTIYVMKPLDFSVFPALLLGTTLARLVLNVASTRLILSRGANEKTGAAGRVIQAFGEFVSGDNVVIGLIIFVILVVIQFLVITKGATRISEVAA